MLDEKKTIEVQYSKFLKDFELHEFQLLADNPNIFDVLRTQKYEIRHSNFLIWLFNPNANHGLGDKFLRMFLYDLSLDERNEDFTIFMVESLNFSNVKLFREWNDIDILIEFDNLVVCIENKINHFESPGQLKKYEGILHRQFVGKKHVFVFLNPYDQDATHSRYIKYSYESLITYIEQILSMNKSVKMRTQIYLEDYVNNLKNNIMDTGKKREIANSIYYRHRELIDFVIKHKYDAHSQIKSSILDKIKKRGWIECSPSKSFIRFLTSDLKFIPSKQFSGGWKGGEAFLLEVHYSETNGAYKVYGTISPCSQPLKGILESALSNVPNMKRERNWVTYYNKIIEVNNQFDDSISNGDYNVIVDEIMLEIDKMVETMEVKLLDKKNEIIAAAK